MATVVTLLDTNGAVLKKAKISERAEIANLLPALITLLGMPLTDDAGRRIKYRLSHQDMLLQDNQTLEGAEVHDGDSLALVVEMIAGAGAQFESNDLDPPEPLVELDSTPIVDSYQPRAGFPPYSVDAQIASVSVAFQDGIMDRVFSQARGLQVEVGGILLGNVYTEKQGLFVVVEEILEAKHTSAGSAYLMFTGETGQDLLQRRAASEFPVVGWYHSHPGFGIFLSSSDEFIQRSFFGNRPWYIALVVDPTSDDWGVFAWEKHEIKRCMNRSAQTSK